MRIRFPSIFYIEPTNDCNLNCFMCGRQKSKKEIGYMKFNLFKDIIDQLVHQDVSSLSLHQTGEPLLHPRIVDMICYAKERGISSVRFATNGTLLNYDLAHGLIDSGLDSLTVSMDSLSAPYYCTKSNVNNRSFNDLDEKIMGLINLRKLLGKLKPEIEMQIISTPKTQDIIHDFQRKWLTFADFVTIKDPLSWGGLIEFCSKEFTQRLMCIHALTQGVVQWDGDVTFCCLYIDCSGKSEGIIGNSNDNSLEDIFFGKKRLDIIRAQLKGCSLCSKCPDWLDYLSFLHKSDTRIIWPSQSASTSNSRGLIEI